MQRIRNWDFIGGVTEYRTAMGLWTRKFYGLILIVR